jgi:hypothetical protein
MKETPKEKHGGYFVGTVIIMIIIYFIVGGIASSVMAAMWRPVLF